MAAWERTVAAPNTFNNRFERLPAKVGLPVAWTPSWLATSPAAPEATTP
jgi:hypothetical protein